MNFSLQKNDLVQHPPKISKGLWVVLGLVEEFSIVQSLPEISTESAHLVARAFFSATTAIHEREEYDFFDIGAKLNLPQVPSSFGGVSGGSLWQVDLMRNKNGVISWDGKRHFRGVAFFESEIEDGRRIIRCHGPRSIYDTAWRQWGFVS